MCDLTRPQKGMDGMDDILYGTWSWDDGTMLIPSMVMMRKGY